MSLKLLGDMCYSRRDNRESYTEVLSIDIGWGTVAMKYSILPRLLVYYHLPDQLSKCLKEKNIPLHMDGARVFNAAVSLEVPVSRIVEHCDSVTFCLSKGLGAPIGSVLTGKKSFIEKARRARKVLGGSMRQAGIVAAAGLHALENCVTRLAEDHSNAKRIAYAIHNEASPWVTVDLNALTTNILLVNINSPVFNANHFVSDLLRVDVDERDNLNEIRSTVVKISQMNDSSVRIVLHKNITDRDVDIAIEKIKYTIRKINSNNNDGSTLKCI